MRKQARTIFIFKQLTQFFNKKNNFNWNNEIRTRKQYVESKKLYKTRMKSGNKPVVISEFLLKQLKSVFINDFNIKLKSKSAGRTGQTSHYKIEIWPRKQNNHCKNSIKTE